MNLYEIVGFSPFLRMPQQLRQILTRLNPAGQLRTSQKPGHVQGIQTDGNPTLIISDTRYPNIKISSVILTGDF